ncbi:MAG TPA: hypothetical protein PKW33_05750 [Anaerolineaceae bacterium]|nr:hypothetical protein [Anaerolineaceae bacterium]HPN51071.1 hypothetical protein [Anaerolineaceae bacterium]
MGKRSGSKKHGTPANKVKYNPDIPGIENITCSYCGQITAHVVAQEWVDGWDGQLINRYRCTACGQEFYEPGSSLSQRCAPET